MKIKILLLQARHKDDQARINERLSFAKRAGLDLDQIVPFDLLGGAPTITKIRNFDVLSVGGSGDYYVSKKNLPNFQATLDVLSEVVSIGHPTFASCFGFQLMVQALGGEIVYDPDCMEVGTYDLSLTEAGRRDELFKCLPDSFKAQLGHKDRASRLPPGVVNLASSTRSPIQAFRVPGKTVWATQFHPELTGQENLARYKRYLDGYTAVMNPEEIQATLNRFAESPETETLLLAFLQLVFG